MCVLKFKNRWRRENLEEIDIVCILRLFFDLNAFNNPRFCKSDFQIQKLRKKFQQQLKIYLQLQNILRKLGIFELLKFYNIKATNKTLHSTQHLIVEFMA